ncbi:MAG TPA: LysM domain-containing protein, partial [Ramlibacter sp.]|uniref:LysM peptidoglycan-binding domain-containing protein n=1 Tax=Ramlibacter sp. TaxID=1917967 RepID=UPI002BE95482
GYAAVAAAYAATAQLGGYTVQRTDSLRSIAQAAYGDANLWYQVARANGIEGDADVRVGMTLTLPNLQHSHNGAGTFTPYDPSRVVGPTDPALLQVKRPDNLFGEFLSAFVAALVATLAGPEVFGAIMGPSTAAAATTAATATAASTTATATAQFAAATVAAAAGSVAGQGVQMAFGNQRGFDIGQLALSVASAAFGQLLPEGLGGAPGTAGNALAHGIVGSALTQGLAMATGLQQSFNWASMVQAVLSSGTSPHAGQGGQDSSRNNAAAYDNAVDIQSENYTPASEYTYRNAMDIQSDEYPSPGELARRKLNVEQQVRREILGQEAREDSVQGAQAFLTGGAARAPMRGGIGSGGFEMVRNGNWDAALNLGADPLGLLGEIPGLQADLARLDRAQIEQRIEGMRGMMLESGASNVPSSYVQSMVASSDGAGVVVKDYAATLDQMKSVYEDYVRDQRLRETWGDNYRDLRIGKSQMTVQEFENKVLDIHMKSTDSAYAAGVESIAKGDLAVKAGEYAKELGTFIDRQVRLDLRFFAKAEGINDSSMSKLWAVNRRIANEYDIGIPDSRLGFNLYADTTLARKNATTPQIMKWNEIRAGNFLIIRPSALGGPYVIPRMSIPQFRPVGRAI